MLTCEGTRWKTGTHFLAQRNSRWASAAPPNCQTAMSPSRRRTALWQYPSHHRQGHLANHAISSQEPNRISMFGGLLSGEHAPLHQKLYTDEPLTLGAFHYSVDEMISIWFCPPAYQIIFMELWVCMILFWISTKDGSFTSAHSLSPPSHLYCRFTSNCQFAFFSQCSEAALLLMPSSRVGGGGERLACTDL